MKKMMILMCGITLCLSLNGCFSKTADNNDVTDNNNTSDINTDNNTNTSDKSSRIREIEADAKKDAENEENMNKESIDEAVTYINEHIDDPFKTDEVSEKLIYYGAYLKHIGSKKVEGSKHDLTVLGENVHKYVSNIYTKTEEKTSDISNGLKDSIEKAMDSIKNTKDKVVDEFYNIVK